MMDLRSLVAGSMLIFGTGVALAQEAATPPATPQAPVASPSVSASLTLTLESRSDIERRTTIYQCDNGDGFRVHYINAAPNFLAIVPVEGETHLFATALSASGARYVSGPYEWWSDGDEATLRDLRSEEDAPPLASCLAAGNAP